MKILYLIRHSLTEANERRLYGGSTDSPLSQRGRALALERGSGLAPCDLYVSSGMRRARETLFCMTGKEPDQILAGLGEMDFGAFEMRSYEELKDDPRYIRWIEDESGAVACPGGESRAAFRDRVLAAGETLLSLPAQRVFAVCHGGVIVNLMQAWFPEADRNFYQWQPAACEGYRIDLNPRPQGWIECRP